jgi:hypothetical protein
MHHQPTKPKPAIPASLQGLRPKQLEQEAYPAIFDWPLQTNKNSSKSGAKGFQSTNIPFHMILAKPHWTTSASLP